jgi:hypothetical protein
MGLMKRGEEDGQRMEEIWGNEQEEALIQLISIAIQSIWVTSISASALCQLIRRSRTTQNTLKITLYYIHQSRREIRREIQLQQHSPLHPILSPLNMFLAALMIASKFLLDRNYSNRACQS